MRSVAKAVVDERRRHPVDKKDLVNAMILGKDPKSGKTLPDENIINNMITFLIAGTVYHRKCDKLRFLTIDRT